MLCVMTQIMGNDKQGLKFEIISARISDDSSEEKKHVIYTLQIRFIAGSEDLSPSVIERRYTHFFNLYNALKKEQPQMMANVPFPKKVIMGNFDNGLISTRSTGFEALLKHISGESKLRTSNALLVFLQDVELLKAKQYLEQKDFNSALPILENIFKLLNKVFTDRSTAVLLALCRLTACAMLSGPSKEESALKKAEKWAELALHRYNGVSDSDLLELYVPLLHTCKKIYSDSGRNKDALEQQLIDLKLKGVRVSDDVGLLEAVSRVEMRIFK